MQITTFPLTPFSTNCFVLKTEQEDSPRPKALVIDPGEPSPALLDCLAGCELAGIVNTHGHCDHCGGNAALVAETGAPLMIHEADASLLSAIAEQGLMFGIEVASSPLPDRYLAEGDCVAVGEASLEVLHTPGHSPGHIALLYRREDQPDALFAGDVLFAGSIGRTDLPGGDQRVLLQSIRDKLLSLSDETIVYSGHGPATAIGSERRSNPFLAGL